MRPTAWGILAYRTGAKPCSPTFALTAFSEVAFLALGDAPIFTGCHYATAGKGIDPLRQEGREGEGGHG
jgi:hypothetical protein